MNEEIKQLTKEELQKADEVARKFIDLLGINADVRVEVEEENVSVVLDTEESGILIGYHGETLDSLQLILSLAISKEIGRFVRAMIDVGDYRKNRTEYLERLTQQIKDRVLRENREQTITNLKSWERRLVHMMLKDDEDVITESEGTGRDRVLVVRPK